jgi:aminopeptidase
LRQPDPDAFAALLCDYCLDVQGHEQVLVRSTTLAAPLLLALQGEILRRGAWPLLRVEVPGEASSFYANAREEQLDDFAPLALTEA